MRALPGRRTPAVAQRGFRKDISAALLQEVSTPVSGILTRYSRNNGTIPRQFEARVVGEVGRVVQRFFVGLDGRSPFADDGVTALATYPRLLNKWLVYVTAKVVYEHRDWMQKNAPEDVFNWLAGRPLPVVSTVAEVENPYLQRPDESLEAYKERLAGIRIFQPNPLAEYEPAHTWVDPNGYRLSDRIWRTSVRTREKLDALVAQRIREGVSALNIAKEVERFLLPDRAPLRTNKPYGTDASFDAMRLARTEISRAHAQASFISAKNNPFTRGMDWALSASHPKTDRCDEKATINMAGERVKPPYPFDAVKLPPDHPHCLCNARPAPVEDSQDIVQQLRAVMQNARQDLFTAVGPAQGSIFIEQLIGRQLMSFAAQLAFA